MKSAEDIRAGNLELLIREVAEGNARRFAEMVDRDPSLISRWRPHNKNRKVISPKTAREIEESLMKIPTPGVRIERFWMDQDHTDVAPAIAVAGPTYQGAVSYQKWPQIIEWCTVEDLPKEYKVVPRMRVRAAAGNGKIVFEAEEHNQGNAFRADWLTRKGCKAENCVMMKVEGDSMEPTYTDGTDLLVDRSAQHIIDRKPYVLLHEGEQKVKRLFKAGDMVVMRSDNRDKYPDLTVPIGDIQIVGRVIWHAGED